MHLSNYSNRQIARKLRLDRKTVNKYVNAFEKQQQLLELGNDLSDEQVKEIIDKITSCKYKERKSAPRKWNTQMDDFLEEILASEKEKAQVLSTKKQQLTKFQIYELIKDAGFDIGKSTVYKKINEKRNTKKEAFIAQEYPFGKRFEYDFGEVELIIAGKKVKLALAVMVAVASGYKFALLYPNQKFDVFCDSQVRFFEHMGGCFEEGVYDNMRNVVSSFKGKSEKIINENLLKLAAYYGFRVVTTNAYSGNEKGSVENAVKVIRQSAFAKKWKFDSLKDAQKHLDDVLKSLNADKELEKEKAALSPYRDPYEAAQINPNATVNKFSCITIDNSQYSVPDCYVGKKVLVKLYPNEVIVMHKNKIIAKHVRSIKENEMVLDINHFLNTFLRKPHALANAKTLLANKELKAVFDEMYKDNPKEFVTILSNCQNLSFDETIAALKARNVALSQARNDCELDPIVEETFNQIKRIKTTNGKVA